MFDTLPAQIGAAVTVVVIALAFLKGDEPERIGGGAFALGWLASLVIQEGGAHHLPQWGLMPIDTAMLVVFAGLLWKSRRAWPAWACAFQALTVMSHVVMLVDPRPPIRSFYIVTNLAAYGILLALAVGALLAWRDRRAAGLE